MLSTVFMERIWRNWRIYQLHGSNLYLFMFDILGKFTWMHWTLLHSQFIGHNVWRLLFEVSLLCKFISQTFSRKIRKDGVHACMHYLYSWRMQWILYVPRGWKLSTNWVIRVVTLCITMLAVMHAEKHVVMEMVIRDQKWSTAALSSYIALHIQQHSLIGNRSIGALWALTIPNWMEP